MAGIVYYGVFIKGGNYPLAAVGSREFAEELRAAFQIQELFVDRKIIVKRCRLLTARDVAKIVDRVTEARI